MSKLPGRHVKDYNEASRPGDFWFVGVAETPHFLAFVCPCGCGDDMAVVGIGQHNIWMWDGNEDAPTLTPSIDRRKELGLCGWHGWLIKGVWEDA